MNFEEALKNELNSIPNLANKVYPLTAIEGVKTPYLVYISSEGLKQKHLNGYSGPNEIQAELHILNDGYSSLKDITKQVIDKVLSFQTRVIGGDGGIFVQDVDYQRPTEKYISELYQYLCVVPITVRI
jgi:hypothetical protein